MIFLINIRFFFNAYHIVKPKGNKVRTNRNYARKCPQSTAQNTILKVVVLDDAMKEQLSLVPEMLRYFRFETRKVFELREIYTDICIKQCLGAVQLHHVFRIALPFLIACLFLTPTTDSQCRSWKREVGEEGGLDGG